MTHGASRRFVSVLFLAAGLSLWTPPTAAPAESVSISAGSRVRLKLASSHAQWITGDLVRANADTLHMVLESSGERVTVPASAAAKLQVRLGRGSHAPRGAIIGGAILGSAALALGIAFASDSFFDTDAGDVVTGTLFGATLGAGFGALIGSAFKTDKWEELPRPWLTITTSPGLSPAGLGICWRW